MADTYNLKFKAEIEDKTIRQLGRNEQIRKGDYLKFGPRYVYIENENMGCVKDWPNQEIYRLKLKYPVLEEIIILKTFNKIRLKNG